MNIDPSALTPDQQFQIARMTIEAEHCENMARILSSTHPLGKFGELFAALGLTEEEGSDLVLARFFPSPKRPTTEVYSDILQSATKLVEVYQAMFAPKASSGAPREPADLSYGDVDSVPLSTCFDVVLSVLARKGFGADEVTDHPATDIEKARQKAESLLGVPREAWRISDLEALAAFVVA